MTGSYVINPFHARRGRAYWFQVGPHAAIELGNVHLVECLKRCYPPGSSSRSLTLREIGRRVSPALPGASARELDVTLRRLARELILVPRQEAAVLAERFFRPALKRAIGLLDRRRIESYAATGPSATAESVLWPPSIFNPLPLDRCVFFSCLLIAATRRRLEFSLRYARPKELTMILHHRDVKRELSSRYRYLPEDPRAEEIVETKAHASYLCARAGLPVPRQRWCLTLAEIRSAARDIGYPVVLKPNRGHDGIDVYPHVDGEAFLIPVARRLLRKWKHRGGLVVEEHVHGNRYRFDVLGSEILEVREALPPEIVGDGTRTIRELVRRENRRRKKAYSREDGGAGIRLDGRVRERLRQKSCSPSSILPAGARLQLHYTLNRSGGVLSRALSPLSVHPAVRAMAIEAVRLFGLHLGGVDYIAPTVRAAPAQCGGRICEVQAHPAIIPGDLDYEDFVTRVLDYALSGALDDVQC